MATFTADLPPMSMLDRFELARHLDETAQRCGINRPGSWVDALQQVLRDLANSARDVQAAKGAHAVASAVTISARVPLNKDGRHSLYRVLKIAAGRSGGAAMERIREQLETFVYGPEGAPSDDDDPNKRGRERPGMWIDEVRA